MSEKTKLDWRRYDIPRTPHLRFDLPNTVKEKLLAMAARFGIHFAAFDLAVTPSGEFVFFEMRSNQMK